MPSKGASPREGEMVVPLLVSQLKKAVSSGVEVCCEGADMLGKRL